MRRGTGKNFVGKARPTGRTIHYAAIHPRRQADGVFWPLPINKEPRTRNSRTKSPLFLVVGSGFLVLCYCVSLRLIYLRPTARSASRNSFIAAATPRANPCFSIARIAYPSTTDKICTREFFSKKKKSGIRRNCFLIRANKKNDYFPHIWTEICPVLSPPQAVPSDY